MPYNVARHAPEKEPRWPVWLIIAGVALSALFAAALVVTTVWWWLGLLAD